MNVKSDPNLSKREKETIIRMDNVDDTLRVATDQRSVVKWCLDHPDLVVTDRRFVDGNIVGVQGILTVSHLQLKGKPRKSTHTSQVLGKLPEDDDD